MFLICDHEMFLILFFNFDCIFTDGVRLRDEHRRRDQRSYSSRRSSTDSSEEGFNLNLRDLKVRQINTSFQLGAVEIMSRRARKRQEESEFYSLESELCEKCNR